MPDRTRSDVVVGQERLCDYCQGVYTPKRPHQRFCEPAHRSAAHREKQLEGVPPRVVTGARQVRNGWSITVHLDDLPPVGPGDQVRVKFPASTE